MNTIKERTNRHAIFFMLLCSAVYFVSYVTRINYGAVIEAMSKSTGILRENAGLVSTTAFFTYGVGQLISGFIGDKVRPRLLIVLGMSITAACNIIMPLLSSYVPMMVLWGINGFAQAMFWPPMVRMMANNLDESNYNRACIWVSAASSIATIVIYLLASLCTALWDWRALFYICAVAAIVMAVIWQIFAPREDILNKTAAPTDNGDNHSMPRMGKAIFFMMIPITMAILLQGILRDGVTTWLPALVSDTFELPDSVAILTGIALPIFSMISYNVSNALEKRIGNELATSAVFFATAAVSAGLLALLLDVSPIISVALLAVITGCMHGINLMLISRVPRYFDKYGKISTISGVVNAFTYVGSALATYIVPLMASEWDWTLTILSWLVIAAAGSVICVCIIRAWNNFRKFR